MRAIGNCSGPDHDTRNMDGGCEDEDVRCRLITMLTDKPDSELVTSMDLAIAQAKLEMLEAFAEVCTAIRNRYPQFYDGTTDAPEPPERIVKLFGDLYDEADDLIGYDNFEELMGPWEWGSDEHEDEF